MSCSCSKLTSLKEIFVHAIQNWRVNKLITNYCYTNVQYIFQGWKCYKMLVVEIIKVKIHYCNTYSYKSERDTLNICYLHILTGEPFETNKWYLWFPLYHIYNKQNLWRHVNQSERSVLCHCRVLTSSALAILSSAKAFAIYYNPFVM